LYSHLSDMSRLRQVIAEWGPPSLQNIYQAGYWFVLVLSGAALGRSALKRGNFVPAHGAAWAFFACSSLGSSRNTGFFALAAIPFAAYAMKDLSKTSLFRASLAILVLCAGYVPAVVWPRFDEPHFAEAVKAEGACRYLNHEKTALKGLRLYNGWDRGGYIGFRLHPDYAVFQDGRYLFHEYLVESHNIKSASGWLAFSKKYGFELAVMERKNNFVQMPVPAGSGKTVTVRFPYYSFLLPPEEWAVVFWDTASVVLVRRASVDGGWLAAREFRHFKPDNTQATALKLALGYVSVSGLEAELARYRKTVLELGLPGSALAALRRMDEIKAQARAFGYNTPKENSHGKLGGRT
ncbi:MAG: hypothetical protein PHW69_07860, partial [Elusimicrobiaceae bacterium]|nr:hypothetical protein [Elusimicrobiaceae bacterium]